MLAIRMQRTGRRGHAHFRVVVQDARKSPTSGKLVAQLGHYNPHTKDVVIDKEKATFYLEHGAQPSPRVIGILKSEKVKLPKWVSEPLPQKRSIRNIDKLRRNRPAEVVSEETPVDNKGEKVAQESSSDSTVEQAPTAEPQTQVDDGHESEKTVDQESGTDNSEPSENKESSSEEKTK